MPFTRELPVWAKVGTKPPATMLNTNGWVPGDKPPADWLNWFFNLSYEAIKELQLESLNVDQKGVINGVATLDGTGKIPSSQLSIQAPADATTAVKGIVMLEDSVASTSILKAATPKSVKTAYDLAQSAFTSANNGKALIGPIATAIVGKGGVVADADADGIATFAELETGVNSIKRGQGNAVATQVLSGATFANADGVLRTGSMADNSNTVITPGNVSSYVPAGYHFNSTVVGDPDLVPENILKGKNIFGVIGTVKNSMNGIGASNSSAVMTVTGLTFTPTRILVSYMAGAVTSYQMSYDLSNRPKDSGNRYLDGYAKSITSNQGLSAALTPVASDLTVSVWNTNSSGFSVTISHANISNISWFAIE